MPVDVKRFRFVAAQLADQTGRQVFFYESGESAGTGPISSVPTGGRYLSASPVLADGEFHELLLDSSGRLLVNTLGGADNHDVAIASTAVTLTGMDAVNPGGSFTTVSADGDATRLRASRAGIQYTALTNATGSSHVTVVDDDAAIGGTPAGVLISGIHRTTLPTYTNGDAVVPHFDDRGRLLVSPGETGLTADIDTEDSAGTANPNAAYTLGQYRATLPTYTDGDAAIFHFTSDGRSLSSTYRVISTTALRAAAVLTGAYVNSASIATDEAVNQLVLLVDATMGSLTSIEVRVQFSDDDATWYTETFGLISGATDSLTLGEHQITADGLYRIPIPVADRFVRVGAKGTGTVTGSSLAIEGIVSAV